MCLCLQTYFTIYHKQLQEGIHEFFLATSSPVPTLLTTEALCRKLERHFLPDFVKVRNKITNRQKVAVYFAGGKGSEHR